MKRQVINTVDKLTVPIGEVSDDRNYGCQNCHGKAIITNDTMGNYYLLYAQWIPKDGSSIKAGDFTSGLFYPDGKLSNDIENGCDSIEIFLEYLLENGYEVFEFDNSYEVMEWMLEK